MKDPKSPATTCEAYDCMLPSWHKVQTVLDGTRAMRAASRKYLPQHQDESNKAYAERLERCTLYNVTKLTLDSWVGRPFGDPVREEGLNTELKALLDDIDLVGNSLHTFAQRWFADGLAKAFSHVYVDYPRLQKNPDGTPRTLADDVAENVRPYWVHLRPEQLFFADAVIVDSKEVLREIRFWEEVTEREGFAEIKIRQIRRVFMQSTPDGPQGTVEIYREVKERGKKTQYKAIDTYTFDFDQIPLVTFYADRSEFMIGVPPLEDLANLNIAHWQSTSDQRACLTTARFPILALSGGQDEEKKLVVGPNVWLWSPDPQSKFYYVEHTGAALEAGEKDLATLEHQMSQYGAEFLKKKPGTLTATARALDSAEATSQLQDATLRFQDALNTALGLMAKWMDLTLTGAVQLSTDFGPEELETADLQTLLAARKARDISRNAFLKELMRRGMLADDFDPEADLEELEKEAMELLGSTGEEGLEDEEDDDKEKPAVEKEQGELTDEKQVA